MAFNYLNIEIRVTIGDRVQFNQVESIHIDNSLEKLADTAKLTLPRAFYMDRIKNSNQNVSKVSILDYIKIGDKIKIEAGYTELPPIETQFEGYITNIKADIPLELECEDEMYQLKRSGQLNKTFSNANLKDILTFIAPKYKIETFKNTDFGKFMIERQTAFQVLEKLKEYGIRAFFKDGILYADMLINLQVDKKNIHQFNMNRNVRKGTELEYEVKEKREFYMKAETSEKGTSKRSFYEYGKKGQNEIIFKCPLNLNKQQLKAFAEDYYNSKVYDGYTGSFDSWGVPHTRAGDSADIKDPNYPDGHRDGRFLIDSVTIDINGNDGFKRKNNVSRKL